MNESNKSYLPYPIPIEAVSQALGIFRGSFKGGSDNVMVHVLGPLTGRYEPMRKWDIVAEFKKIEGVWHLSGFESRQ